LENAAKDGVSAFGRSCCKRLLLAAGGVEVRRIEPSLKRLLPCRPLAVEHREPRRIAVPTFRYHVLPEDALIREPKPSRGPAARKVLRIALPLIAAVAQALKNVPGHQVHGLGGGGCALQCWRQQDVAYLDYPMRRFGTHKAGPTHGSAGRRRQNRQENGSRRCLLLSHRTQKIGLIRIRTIEEPRPYLIMPPRSLPEGSAVALGI